MSNRQILQRTRKQDVLPLGLKNQIGVHCFDKNVTPTEPNSTSDQFVNGLTRRNPSGRMKEAARVAQG
jgi:hypothetical protein